MGEGPQSSNYCPGGEFCGLLQEMPSCPNGDCMFQELAASTTMYKIVDGVCNQFQVMDLYTLEATDEQAVPGTCAVNGWTVKGATFKHSHAAPSGLHILTVTEYHHAGLMML